MLTGSKFSKIKDKKPVCAYCSMPAEFACDKKTGERFCLVLMCKKHVNNNAVDGRELCREHRVQSVPLTNLSFMPLT